jgi:hypothetical protein
VSVKEDRRAVSAMWSSSFTLVLLLLISHIITGGVSASKLRSWRKYPDMNPLSIGNPSPLFSGKMVTGTDGSLWFFGGQRDVRGFKSEAGDLYKLDVQTEEWTTITTSGVSPTARDGHSMGSTDGFLWVFGGNTRFGRASGKGETRSVCVTVLPT